VKKGGESLTVALTAIDTVEPGSYDKTKAVRKLVLRAVMQHVNILRYPRYHDSSKSNLQKEEIR
jgi:hypothetical protein